MRELTPDGFVIRPATIEDAACMNEIWSSRIIDAAPSEVERGLWRKEWCQRYGGAFGIEKFQTIIDQADRNEQCYMARIASVGSSPVGITYANAASGERVDWNGITLDREYEKRGIASLLGREVIQWAQRWHPDKLIVGEVDPANRSSVQLFRRLGFQGLGQSIRYNRYACRGLSECVGFSSQVFTVMARLPHRPTDMEDGEYDLLLSMLMSGQGIIHGLGTVKSLLDFRVSPVSFEEELLGYAVARQETEDLDFADRVREDLELYKHQS